MPGRTTAVFPQCLADYLQPGTEAEPAPFWQRGRGAIMQLLLEDLQTWPPSLCKTSHAHCAHLHPDSANVSTGKKLALVIVTEISATTEAFREVSTLPP